MASYVAPNGKLIIEMPIGHPPPPKEEEAMKVPGAKEQQQQPSQQETKEATKEGQQEKLAQQEVSGKEEKVQAEQQKPAKVQGKQQKSAKIQKEQQKAEKVQEEEQKPSEKELPKEKEKREAVSQPEEVEKSKEMAKSKEPSQEVRVMMGSCYEDILPRIVDGKHVEMRVQLPEPIDASKLKVNIKDNDVIIMVRDEREKWDSLSETFYYRRTTLPDNTDFKRLKCVLEGDHLCISAPLKEIEREVSQKSGSEHSGAARLEAAQQQREKTVA